MVQKFINNGFVETNSSVCQIENKNHSNIQSVRYASEYNQNTENNAFWEKNHGQKKQLDNPYKNNDGNSSSKNKTELKKDTSKISKAQKLINQIPPDELREALKSAKPGWLVDEIV